jgi:YHS domain-containing protein
MTNCTVCEGWMNENEEITTVYDGDEYQFCSEEHRKEFKAAPENHID